MLINLFSQNVQSFLFPYYMDILMVRTQYQDPSTVLAVVTVIYCLVNGVWNVRHVLKVYLII